MSHSKFWAQHISDIILGGQDGLVNVLGVALGVAAASGDTRLILAAALAATFAESVSMAAVAYTSTKAERDYLERKERDANGGKEVVREIEDDFNPVLSGVIVGVAALIGSFVPLLPFFWLPVVPAMLFSIVVSAIVLFIMGAYKAHLTIGHWAKSGTEIMVIGLVAAFIGYIVGFFFQI